jgi:hypothetical protein
VLIFSIILKDKRAISVQKVIKEDRSLSPMKFHDAGKRRFAAITNKDWALSEIYQYVRKEQDPNTKNREELEENFK